MAQQIVPDSFPQSPAITQAIGEAWLTEEERADLRVRHGRWTSADLESPRRAARAALDTWDLDNPLWEEPIDAAIPKAWRAEVLLRRGKLNDALAAVAGDDSPAAASVRCATLAALGRAGEALGEARSLDPLLEDGATDDPDDIVAAARAAMVRGTLEPRSVNDWQRVIDALGRGRLALDRLHWPSLLVEGTLLAEKHHPELAVPALVQAMELGPKASDIWYQAGLLALDRFAFEDAERAVKLLRRVRPGHPLAEILAARMALERRDPERAEALLDPLLKREPGMPEALALRAAAAASRYNLEEARSWLARLEAIMPGNALGPATVGRFLGDARQYESAASFLEEAIGRAPAWSTPRISLGLLETQTGRDDRARRVLREANELDPFNKRAQNSLTLLDEIAGYTVFEGRHFVVRCKPGADEMIARMMPAALDAMHETVAKRFRHEPAERTIIDLLPDHASFAVRITGMPQIHTIAACTGPLIAIEVPKEGPRNRHFGLFDWLKVLRHEYTHTVTLSQTRNRIPHWLTEAAAVSMEGTPRDWPTCQMLARELQEGTLFDLDSINWGFVRPRRPQDRHLAYAQGHWMVEFMNRRFGEDALVRLLEIYRTGKTEEQSMSEALGVSREAFYRAFLEWAKDDVRAWGLAATPSLPELVMAERNSDPELREAYRKANEESLRATAERIAEGIAEPIGEGEVRERRIQWAAVDLPPFQPDASVIVRWLAEYPDHPDVLERILRQAINALGDAPLDPLTLDLLSRYMRARPVDPNPHRILAKRELASDDPTRAIPHLVELDVREEHDNAYAIELAKLYRQAGDAARASASVERAVRMDPYDAALRELAAAVAIEAGDLTLARQHVVALDRLEPDQPRHKARLAKLDELLKSAK